MSSPTQSRWHLGRVPEGRVGRWLLNPDTRTSLPAVGATRGPEITDHCVRDHPYFSSGVTNVSSIDRLMAPVQAAQSSHHNPLLSSPK